MPSKNSAAPAAPQTVEAKLDEMLMLMHRMDKRDKWRTIGGFFRALLALIPLFLLLGSAWYFALHGAEVMKAVADQAAQSAAAYTQKQGSGMLDQFMKEYSIPKSK